MKTLIKTLAVVVVFGSLIHPASLFGSLIHPARITFWQNDAGEYDFMVKDHLGGDHERICGTVSKDGALWDSLTFKSGGAHEGVTKNGLPLDAAKLAVEQDCR